MSKLKTSAAAKAYFSRYEANDTARKNKEARLARHIKNHPNDEQSAKMKGRLSGTRKPSVVKGNFPDPITRLRDKAGHVTATVEVHQLQFKNKAK